MRIEGDIITIMNTEYEPEVGTELWIDDLIVELLSNPRRIYRREIPLYRKDESRTRQHLLMMRRLKNSPCKDCGEIFDAELMEFDHRPGEIKIDSVSHMLNYSLDNILEEIRKCDLVCRECHKIRTKARKMQRSS